MTTFKKILVAGTMTFLMGATSITAFAASQYKTPVEAVAGITGKTVESVIAERNETGKTYGTIASDAGKLDAFKAEMLELKKDILKAQVESGAITQERADEIIKAIAENQATCDGTGSARIGQGLGARFGSNGTGLGRGGRGMGIGGMGLQDGSCYVQ